MVSPARLSEDLRSLVREGERVELPADGAAVIPLEDLRLLEELEDQADIEEIRRRLGDEKAVPYSEARLRLGLG